MMNNMNILKNIQRGSLIALLACLLFSNSVWASDLADCIGKNYAGNHNKKSTICSTDHCADMSGSGLNGSQILSSMKSADGSNCLSQLPMQSSGYISAPVGVRTDYNKNGDGTRPHEGIDVTTGHKLGVQLYAPAQAIRADVKAPSSITIHYDDGAIERVMGNISAYYGKHGGKAKKMTCDVMSHVYLTHKRGSTSQKGCDTYETRFYHLVNIRIPSGSKPIGKGTWIGDAGGCQNYAVHMHYEIRDCDNTLYNPMCPEGQAGSPQQFCDGTQNVLPPNQDSGETQDAVTNPHLSKIKDCSKEADQAECEKRNEAIRNGTTYCKPATQSSGNSDKTCNVTKTATGETIPIEIQNAIAEASQQTGIPAVVLAALIQTESRFKVDAKSGVGAQGLTQIMPATWKWYSTPKNQTYEVCDKKGCRKVSGLGKCSGSVWNARDNILCGAQILKDNLKTYNGDLQKALTAYNTGAGNVNKAIKACGSSWQTCSTLANEAKQYGPKNANNQSSIASKNNCSVDALGISGDCEDFRFDAYATAAGYGASGGGVDWNSEHQCNIAENYSSIQGCLFCNLFRVVFDTASIAARSCHNLFSKSLIKLLAIGLAIVIAMIVLRYVSAWKVAEPALLINELLQKIFVVAFIIVLLKLDVTEFFNMFVTPIFTAGFKMASLIISDATTCDTAVTGTVNGIGLPAEMGNSMLCAIYSVQYRLEKLLALGSNSICIAVWIRSYWHIPIFPHMGYFLTGLFLWLIAAVFMIAYPFLLVDSVLQFGIASSLFPVALASSAFKLTSKYLNIWKIVNIFASAMFNFIFLTTVLFILLKGMDTQVIKPIIERAYNNAGTSGFFNLEVLAWFMKDFILLVFFLFLGKAVLEDIPNFADDYAKALTMGEGGSSRLGIGRKLGGTALSGATNLTKATAGKAAGYAWQGTKSIARGGKNFVVGAARSARHNWIVGRTQKKMAAAAAAAAAAGQEFNPETFAASGHTFWGRKTQRRLIQNADGTVALESTKKSWFRGRTVTNVEDENVSVRTKTYKDGSKKDTINIKNPYMKRLINRDGTRNQLAMNDLLQTSNLPPEVTKKAVLNQLMAERFSGMGKKGSLNGRYRNETIRSFVNKDGKEVFEVRRTNMDGTTSIYKWTKGETRDLIEIEQIKKSGKSTKWSSDGLLQKKEAGQHDLNQPITEKALDQTLTVDLNKNNLNDVKLSNDGKITDSEGKEVGKLNNGLVVDKEGKILGSMETKTSSDGTSKLSVKAFDVAADGQVYKADGSTIGKVLENGTVVDENNRVIGKIETPELVFDKDGNVLGKMTEDHKVVDAQGKVIAQVFDDGQVVNAQNETIANVSAEQMQKFEDMQQTRYTSDVIINGAETQGITVAADGSLRTAEGQTVGKVTAAGNIIDDHGHVIGTANTDSLAFSADGKALGKIVAQQATVYKHSTREQGFNILGKVVNDNGNTTGYILADGRIVDMNGSQVLGQISENQHNAINQAIDEVEQEHYQKSSVEFSHSRAYKGAQIFDDDGRRVSGMEDEELLFGDDDIALYQRQMKRYGDVLKHHRFGR